jgi:hypothetical protein
VQGLGFVKQDRSFYSLFKRIMKQPDLFIHACKSTFHQLFFIGGPWLAGCVVLHCLSRALCRVTCFIIGRRAYIWTFGWFGTAVHELGHAVFCLFFRHRIRKIKLFTLDPKAEYQGVVAHRYSRLSPYQCIGNFFIMLGPIIFGALVIFWAACYLFPESDTMISEYASTSAWQFVSTFAAHIFKPENLCLWQFWVFLYILLSIATSIALSPEDLKAGKSGFFVLIALLFVVNLIRLK